MKRLLSRRLVGAATLAAAVFMSPPGRLQGEYRRAQPEGTPVSTAAARPPDVSVSADARRLWSWVMRATDHGGAPFIVIDKRRRGNLRAQAGLRTVRRCRRPVPA